MLHRFVHSWCFKHKVVLVHPFKPDLTVTSGFSCTLISANALLFYLELYNVPALLLQRYDPDPAAKAAAATVLASKLGADSGLKVFMGDDSKFNPPTGKSNEAEFVQSSGLRKRKQSHTRSSSTESAVLHHSEEEMLQYAEPEGLEMSKHDQLVVEHQNPTGLHAQDGGWIARIAALLVGEDPTQSYALICGNCHMHNGEYIEV